ncbi:MAG: hypothetical protein JXA81_13285, partial [Sedimentisphaerales bacterium]|nr:hypothetical protein [Sedimentisphaerales bacterium]
DLECETFIRRKGWDVFRFSDDDVKQDAEPVARGIVKHLGLKYEFNKRQETGSGSHSRKPSP